MTKTALHKLIFDLDNEGYHRGTAGFSSSQLKDLLEDEYVFIAKHIEKTVQREEVAAFDTGTYFHTGILEPHKLKTDCAVYPGKIRRGAKWDAFKAKHKGKAVLTISQKEQAEGLIKAVKQSKQAMKYLGGKPEVSLFTEIAVTPGGEIFAPHFGMRLTRDGWTKDIRSAKDAKKIGYKFVIKVRADMLGQKYISDLKSTSSNSRWFKDMQKTVSDYDYDLSAALYLDMFQLIRPELRSFYWIFASKKVSKSKTWRARKESLMIQIGRAKYMYAMRSLAKCAANNWKVEDTIEDLKPVPWDHSWLQL